MKCLPVLFFHYFFHHFLYFLKVIHSESAWVSIFLYTISRHWPTLTTQICSITKVYLEGLYMYCTLSMRVSTWGDKWQITSDVQKRPLLDNDLVHFKPLASTIFLLFKHWAGTSYICFPNYSKIIIITEIRTA